MKFSYEIFKKSRCLCIALVVILLQLDFLCIGNGCFNMKQTQINFDIKEEVWKDILDYEEYYEVSNFGKIRGKDRTIIALSRSQKLIKRKETSKYIKPMIDRAGYYSIGLSKQGKVKTFRLHRLVACAFISNPDNKPHINHINGIKADNSVENLEWCTPKENEMHSREILGKKPANQKLFAEEINFIIKNYKNGYSGMELAKKFNVHYSTIYLIIRSNQEVKK